MKEQKVVLIHKGQKTKSTKREITEWIKNKLLWEYSAKVWEIKVKK